MGCRDMGCASLHGCLTQSFQKPRTLNAPTCQDADDLAETRRKARRINHYLDRPGILTRLDSA